MSVENHSIVSSEYGSMDKLPEHVQEYFKEIHDELTVDQLRCCGDYFNHCADKLCDGLKKDITMEDFEKIKGKDMDDDNEEGESY